MIDLGSFSVRSTIRTGRSTDGVNSQWVGALPMRIQKFSFAWCLGTLAKVEPELQKPVPD